MKRSVTTKLKNIGLIFVFTLVALLKYGNSQGQTLTTMPVPLTFCSCNSVTVNYTSSGATFNPGNIFLVQLSNAAGNFAGATNIGNLPSTAPNGSIPCVIPCNTPYGTGYRIRVISNSPFLIGSDNGLNITINPSPIVSIALTNGNCVDTLTAVVAPAAVGVTPGEKYYITNNPPWGSPSNVNEMNTVFGPGNWIQTNFAQNPATIFIPTTQFVFLEGSDGNAIALNTYITANITLIENWVSAGGRLFLNAAPNNGGVQNWGFGGTTLNYMNLIPPTPNAVPGVNISNPVHPINVGPYTPLSPGGVYTANYFAHANVVNGGTTLIHSSANSLLAVLTEKVWGAGLVLFGGMTTSNWHNNVGGLVNAHAINLRQNILYYTAGSVLTPTYTYLWAPGGQVTQKILPVASGIYTVTVTSNNGCTGTATYNYTAIAPPPVVNITASGALCAGGTVVLNAGPGFNSYLWDNGLISQTRTIAAPGTYWVTVTNGQGCTASDTIVVTMAPNINLAAAASPPIACNGGTTTIFAIANGGLPPFEFSFNGGPYQVSNQYVAVAGTYTVTVKDANNCTKSTVLNINQPAPINIGLVYPPPPCNGLTNLTVNATGGIPAYQYSLNAGPFQLGNQFLNVGAGTYTVTVKDANNCTNTSSFTIVANNALSIAMTNITNVTCNPLCNGTAQATAVGGTPAYTYAITAPGVINANTGAITGLCAGTYTITVTDATLCTATTSITITQPPVLNLNVSNITNVTCNPLCNGTAQATAVGGTPAYTYAITAPGVINAGTGAISALCAGTYTVTVTDANLCTATTTFTVTQPPLLSVTVSNITNVTCNPLCNGTAQATGTGGVNPLTYSISAPGIINAGTGAISGLCAGTYTVTVTDANLCTATTTFTVTQPPLLTLNVSNIANVSCNGLCDGSAQANGGGGANPLTYSITAPGVINAATGAITALCAGTYTVTVTDANLCSATTTFTVTEPPAILLNITATTAPSCTPGCDGIVTVAGPAGVSFTILPNAGIVQNPSGTFSGLCAGTNYVITGTDANGCTATTNISLSTPNAPVVSISNITNVTCNGLCNGAAQASAVGGTPSYVFSINAPGVINPGTGAITGLCAGSYTVTVTDANTCIGTTSFTVTEPQLLTIAINTTTPVSCVPGCDGTATTTAAGGTLAYTYSISGGAAINAAGTASGLCAGTTYTITVTDANLCTATTTVLLAAPVSPTLSVSNITNVSCNGLCNGTAQAIGLGGVNPLAYSITAPGVIDAVTGAISGLCAGTYTVTVTDANLCTATTSFTVTEPPVLTLTVTNIINVSCNGLCDGSAQANGNGGTNPLTYSITAPGVINAATGAISALCAGTYTVTVTDANLCTATTSFTITQSPVLTLTVSNIVNVTCNGLCNGTAQANGNGGTNPLNYTITAPGVINAATGAISALCAGTYTVTVTDANLCSATTTFTVTEPPVLALTISNITNIACNGVCDGTAQATGLGGTNPLIYSITAPGVINANTGAISALCAGTYTVTVTDANLCTATTTFVVTQPPLLTVTVSNITNVTCNGSCDGTAQATGAGGIAPLTYAITAPGVIDVNTGAITALCAGTYTVTVTDLNLCTATTTFTVTEPLALSVTVSNIVSPLCYGLCDGTAQATAAGGTNPVTYTITAPGIININTGAITALCAGSYLVTATDANLCTATTVFTVTQPLLLTVAISNITDVTCNGLCNGTAQATAADGTPAYTYSINAPGVINPATGAISGLCAATYTVTVTDANLCTATTTFTVTEPPLLSIAVSNITNVTCNGACDGTAQATGTGGTNPLTYAITAPGVIDVNTGAITALCAGTYTVTVTDGNLCTATTTFTVTQPPLLSVTVSNITNVICNGACDGTAQATATGGTNPVTYAITAPGVINANTGAITALCAGTYTVTVTDASLCTATTTFTVTEPAAVVTTVTSTVNPTCTPGCDGVVVVNGTGGTGAIIFSIAPNAGITQNPAGTFTGLCAGTNYIITGTDANGCTGTTNISLSTPNGPTVTVSNITNVTCNGSCDGTAQAAATGGTAPYSYSINAPGVINPATGNITGLCAGTYTVTVTDANTCIGTTSFTVTEPILLTVDINTTVLPNCNPGCNGTATTITAGGTAGYSYAISGGAAINAVGDASNLCAGTTYTITVTDANNCTAQTTVLLAAPNSPTITVSNITDVTCNGLCNGTSQSTATGGTLPYTYAISAPGVTNPATGANSGLCAGTYTVTVTDANLCTATTTFTVTEPPLLTVTVNNIVDVSCFGQCDGTAQATATGGTAPITYAINIPGVIDVNTGAITSLCPGTYTVTVTDANLCTATTTFTVAQPNALTVNISNITNVTCNGLCNGTAQATGSGGTPAYVYSINAPGVINAATGAITGLCAGTYTVTITDANACTGTTSFTVTEPNLLVVNINATTPVSCVPGCDGTATTTTTGGTPAYTYSISGGAAIDALGNASSLCAGTVYTITVTDANGCTGTTTIQLIAPNSPTIVINTTVPPSCVPGCDGNATTTTTGGTPGYTYTISGGAAIDALGNASNLCGGITYTITVTDANSCTATTTIQLVSPNSPTITINTTTPVSCTPGCDGTATTITTGGTPTYTYVISGGATIDALGNANGLCGGITYTITVTDANGCTGTTTIQLIAPSAPVINIVTTTPVSCVPGCDGTATTAVVGGTPAYTYTISGGATIDALGNASGLCGGIIYTITVTDANACTGTTTVQLTAPNSPTITINTTTPVSCVPGCDGTATTTTVGGTPAYTYTISGGATIDALGNASGLCGGIIYTITVTDANACTGTTTIQLTAPNSPSITINTTTPVTCIPGCDGTATTITVGGTPAYSYAISGGAVIDASGNASNLCASIVYTITVTDASGCTGTTTVQLIAPNSPTISITTQTNVSCFGVCDGSVTVAANGGVPGYTYTINPAAAQAPAGTFTGLCAGSYTVTVTDAAGCSSTVNVNITQPTLLTVNVPAGAITNVLIPGGNTGAAVATATGGTPGYTYTITPLGPQGPTGNFVNLTAQCYTVTVTDANGCTATTTFCVTEPGNFVPTAVATDESCFGVCDGTITTTVAGGLAPLNYVLNPGAVANGTGFYAGLCPGTYTVTVTDANNVTATTTATVNGPTQIVFNAPVVVAPTCVPNNNGTISISATGGTPGYSYTISPLGPQGPTGNFTGLTAQQYTITVTDANGCTATTTVVITSPNSPTVTVSNITNVLCNGQCNGTAQANGSGGVNPLTYSISAPGVINAATGAITGLCAGTYTVTVTDANLCTGTTSFTVTQPNSLTITQASSTNVTCNGLSNGSIVFTVTGGFGPIMYTNAPLNNFNNLPANTYTATATDGNGCTITSTFVITEPAVLQITNATVISPLCNGQANGSIGLTINGGTTLYTVTINPNPPAANTPLTGVSPLTITGLNPGTYTVTVTDANGCTTTTVATVTGSPSIVFTTANVTNPTCNGSCNGTINVGTTGGAGVITYTINPAAVQAPSGTFTALCAGVYTVTATDANGCTSTTSLTVIDPAAVVYAAVAHTDPLCGGGNDGTITVALSGGAPGYTYTLSPNNGLQAPQGTFTGLPAAQYTVTGTDASGCSVTTIIDLISPVTLSWNNAAAVNVTCFGAANGAMNVDAAGGVGQLTYSIVPLGMVNNTGQFSPLPPQCYTVTATDVNGCTLTATLCVTEPPQLSLGAPAVQNNSCFGDTSGTITINAIGGNPLPNYTYVLTPGGQNNTTGMFTGLQSGTYAVTVTDGSGCTATTGGIVINQPPAIVFNTVNLHEVYCYGDATGSIAVVASGGTGNIVFSITPNATQFPLGFFKDLSAGTYVITATDGNGCTSTTAATITQNPELRFTSLTMVEPICAYDSTGIISVTATGGSAPIMYSLNNGLPKLTGTFTGLYMDNYKITLIDNLGCSVDTNVVLSGPTLVGATLVTEDTKCIDSKDGRVYVTGTGGRGNYVYYVTPGLNINKTGNFYGLAAGTYTLRVVDNVGCEYMTTFTINPPANPLGNTMTKLDLNCHGKGNEGSATANVFGGQPPYVYEWSTTPVQNTATASTLYFGWYNVLIADANGCELRDSVYIEEGPCCDVSFIPNAFSPNGDNNNDEFRVFSTAGIVLIQLEVYDRWGQKLWSTADWRRGWDGTVDGKESGVGTYFYVFRYTCTRDGQNYIRKGDVTLIR